MTDFSNRPEDAVSHVAGADVLKARPRLRLVVATLWSGFIGACLLMFAELAHMLRSEDLPTLREQSLFFITAWLISMVPAAMAGVLAQRPVPRARKDAS